MNTFELRYVNNNTSIKFSNVNSILASKNDLISKAKSEGVTIAGTNENPILLFFNEQQMYCFSQYISNNILWYPFLETQSNILGSLIIFFYIFHIFYDILFSRSDIICLKIMLEKMKWLKIYNL